MRLTGFLPASPLLVTFYRFATQRRRLVQSKAIIPSRLPVYATDHALHIRDVASEQCVHASRFYFDTALALPMLVSNFCCSAHLTTCHLQSTRMGTCAFPSSMRLARILTSMRTLQNDGSRFTPWSRFSCL